MIHGAQQRVRRSSVAANERREGRTQVCLEKSVPIGTLQLLQGAAGEIGFDVAPILRAAGIGPQALESPLTPMPIHVAGQIFLRAATESGCAHLAALAGARARLHNAGLLPLLVMREARVRDAIVDLTRFLRIWYRGVHLGLHVEGPWARFTVVVEGSFPGYADLCTSYTASMSRNLEAIVGSGWHPSRIYLARPKPAHHRPYHDIFQTQVIFEAPAYAIEFPASVLDHRRDVTDERFNELLREQLIGLESSQSVDIVEHVRRLIELLLSRGDCNVTRVAQLLAIHRQTLFRYLRDSGTTFEAELDKARREIAERLLASGMSSLSDISRALGYKVPVSFTRAFKRWHGVTPLQWRRSRKAPRRLRSVVT